MTSGVCVKGMATVKGKIWASSNWHLFLKKNLPGHPRSWRGVLEVARHVSRDGVTVALL